MVEEVKDTDSGKAHENALQPKSRQQFLLDIGPPKTWPIIVTGLSLSAIAIGGVYTIVRVASVFNEIGAIATFITGSIVGLFTLLAIVAQAAIYWQQRNFMMRQWKATQDSVDRTDTIIDRMTGQLDAMKAQSTAIKTQAQAALDAVATGKDQLEAMKGQLTAMKRQEKAMREQAKLMDRSLVLGTRAYVGVHNIVFDPLKKRVFLYVENIGRVPAKNIQVIVELILRIPEQFMPLPAPDGTRRGWEFRDKPDEFGDGSPFGEWELRIPWLHPYGRTKLFPGSLRIGIMIRLDEVFYLTPQQYDTITAGHTKMFVRGAITYSDGFHSGKKTEFAFRYYLRDNFWISVPETGMEKYRPEPPNPEPDSDYNPN
jgi:hypothetical protein